MSPRRRAKGQIEIHQRSPSQGKKSQIITERKYSKNEHAGTTTNEMLDFDSSDLIGLRSSTTAGDPWEEMGNRKLFTESSEMRSRSSN